MKKIRIKFVDFWKGFDKENNEFVKILEQRYNVEISETPEFVFFSCFGNEHLKYDCIRIYFTGECIVPDFNICDYAIGFDDLVFGDRYIRVPLYIMFQYYNEFLLAQEKHNNIDDQAVKSKKFCNFVYSNCFAQDSRTMFYNMLSDYKKVDSGGRYLNNVGGAVKNKHKFQEKYKFSIAFENCVQKGYTTEKIVEAFAAGTIPIYYGNPDISKEFNTKAFINCHEFSDFNEVIARIKEIDEDDDLYNQILREPIKGIDKKEELKKFLYSIFDQEVSKAGRRGAGIRQKQIEKKEKRYGRAYKFLYGPQEWIINIFKKIWKGALF